MKYFLIFLFTLALVACSGPRAVYDYDPAVNFNYSAVSIYPELQTGLSQLDENRLLNSVEGVLQQKPIAYSESSPELYLNIYTEEYREPSRSNFGIGIGGTGRNVGVGVSGGIPVGGPDTFLKLTFDLIDIERDELVWQAEVTSKFNANANPEQRQKLMDKVVQKAFKNYPPKKAK